MKKKLVLAIISLLSVICSFGQQTKIVAHRGAWKNTNVPQNSIASLREAIKQQVWGAEFDVHITKDDVLVVNHDNDFYGIDIATSSYQELLEKKHSNGELIPTLEEYLKEGIQQNKTTMVLELKPSKLGVKRTVLAAELALKLVKELKAEAQTVYISFSYPACLKFRELDANAHIQYLHGDKTPQELKADQMNGFDYHGILLSERPEYIAQAKSIGLVSNVWTINKEEHMKHFIDLKIDFITTDEPELLQKLLH